MFGDKCNFLYKIALKWHVFYYIRENRDRGNQETRQVDFRRKYDARKGHAAEPRSVKPSA